MHGGSPIVEAVRDRYELVETEITVLTQRINNKPAYWLSVTKSRYRRAVRKCLDGTRYGVVLK